MSYPAMMSPHHYRHLWALAIAETDETAPGGRGREGNTLRELYPGSFNAPRRREATTAMRALERFGLVERASYRRGTLVWQTTARGYEIVFPS